MARVIVELLYRDAANYKSSFTKRIAAEKAPAVGDEIVLDKPYHGLTKEQVWKEHHAQYSEPLGKDKELDHNILEVHSVKPI